VLLKGNFELKNFPSFLKRLGRYWLKLRGFFYALKNTPFNPDFAVE
jgi:prolyl oligopeptidase PreP (S9A serine peptidase family)